MTLSHYLTGTNLKSALLNESERKSYGLQLDDMLISCTYGDSI